MFFKKFNNYSYLIYLCTKLCLYIYQSDSESSSDSEESLEASESNSYSGVFFIISSCYFSKNSFVSTIYNYPFSSFLKFICVHGIYSYFSVTSSITLLLFK